ncbi:MAG: pilin [Patescibacteria group bacterium]|jgi:hypothetical protein
MEKIINFKVIKNLALVLILWFVILAPLFSQAKTDNLYDAFGKNSTLDEVAGPDGAGYNVSDSVTAESMISLVITTALSFIGVLFLILAIYGGYIWMLARGNEQEVEKAKQIIQNAIIGLVVVLAAYAISWYVINALGTATLEESGPELLSE